MIPHFLEPEQRTQWPTLPHPLPLLPLPLPLLPSLPSPSLFLSHLGLADPFALSDAALQALLTPLSQGWFRLGPAARISSTPIPFDGISILLYRLDDVLRRYVQHNQLLLHEQLLDEEAAGTGAGVAGQGGGSGVGGSAEDKARRIRVKNEAELMERRRSHPLYRPSVEPSPPSNGFVLVVLRFSTTLLSHASSVSQYPSMPALLALLNSDDLAIVNAALYALIQFQHGSARIFAFSAFTTRYGLRIKPYLIAFATGLMGQERRGKKRGNTGLLRNGGAAEKEQLGGGGGGGGR